MGFAIDTSTEFGAKTARRVVEEKLAWLTTIDSKGTPQPNPVWFMWDDGTFVVFSQPNQAKLANIARTGLVQLRGDGGRGAGHDLHRPRRACRPLHNPTGAARPLRREVRRGHGTDRV